MVADATDSAGRGPGSVPGKLVSPRASRYPLALRRRREGRMRRVAAIVMVAVLGGGGAGARADWDEDTFTRKTFATYSIPTPPKGGRPSQTVIGSVRAYRIRKGDTLIDLARWFSLGYNEITEANPGVDPWIPPAGSTILLPTEWVLPCCTYEGLIVNIPEMRLFLYRRASGDPHTTIVHT